MLCKRLDFMFCAVGILRRTSFSTNNDEAVLFIHRPLVLDVESLEALEQLLVDGSIGIP